MKPARRSPALTKSPSSSSNSSSNSSSPSKPRLTVAAAALAFVVVIAGAAAVGGFYLGTHFGGTVATVNGSRITRAQLYDRMVAAYGSTAMDQLIDERILDQELAKAHLTVTDADVTADINKLAARYGGTQALEQALASNGLTMEQLRADSMMHLKAVKVLEKGVATDDATLQKYYDEHTNDFDKRLLHARHIVAATEAEAKDIRAQLMAGADFATLAKSKSTDATDKDKGGDLGTFGRGTMETAFDDAAFALKVNDFSQPVQTSDGWQIIQVLSIQGSPPTFAAAKEDVKAAVVNEAVDQQYSGWIQGQRAAAKITNNLTK